jgi:hypothetical protein
VRRLRSRRSPDTSEAADTKALGCEKEVIARDDGSRDGTPERTELGAATHRRIEVVRRDPRKVLLVEVAILCTARADADVEEVRRTAGFVGTLLLANHQFVRNRKA